MVSSTEQASRPRPARLIADRLTCRRGERTLFENLSFSVERGSGLVLTGPNGVGKTSLLRILAGLLPSNAGEARVDPAQDVSLAEQCHFVGVRDGLKASLTLREHIDFWMGADLKSHLEAGRHDYLARVTLAEWRLDMLASTPCGWLSTGQRRRAALARLFCSYRPVWLLDEPLNGLDAWSAGKLKRACVRHMASGGIVVAASHQPLDWTYMTTLPLGAALPEQSPSDAAAP